MSPEDRRRRTMVGRSLTSCSGGVDVVDRLSDRRPAPSSGFLLQPQSKAALEAMAPVIEFVRKG